MCISIGDIKKKLTRFFSFVLLSIQVTFFNSINFVKLYNSQLFKLHNVHVHKYIMDAINYNLGEYEFYPMHVFKNIKQVHIDIMILQMDFTS